MKMFFISLVEEQASQVAFNKLPMLESIISEMKLHDIPWPAWKDNSCHLDSWLAGVFAAMISSRAVRFWLLVRAQSNKSTKFVLDYLLSFPSSARVMELRDNLRTFLLGQAGAVGEASVGDDVSCAYILCFSPNF